MSNWFSPTYIVPITEIEPYIEKNMVSKQALKLALKRVELTSNAYPLICGMDNRLIMGIVRYYALLEAGLENVEIVYMLEPYSDMELYFRYFDFVSSNSANIVKRMAMLPTPLPGKSRTRKKFSGQELKKLCSLTPRPSAHIRNGFFCYSIFETDNEGFTLDEIKESDLLVDVFCDNLCRTLIELFGIDFSGGDWCICTTPRRRHKEGFHFATAVCEATSEVLCIPFYPDVVSCANRSRLEPKFTLEYDPPEQNVILFDDIITTGITLSETRRLLIKNHTVIPIIGVKNHK